MNNLIKTEWLKIKKYPAFWWVIGITTLSYPGINYIFHHVYENIVQRPDNVGKLAKLAIGNPFSFPEAWHTVAYFSSWFVFIPSVVVIMFITNEYTFKTHRQNIIDGWSRPEFMTAKLIDVLLVSLMITLLYVILSLVIGFTNADENSGATWSMVYYAGLFALQTFAQLSLAFLIGFLVRKAFIALGIFLFYFLILEPILVGILKYNANDIGRFLPLTVSNRLIPLPAFLGKIDIATYHQALDAIKYHVVYTIILLGITWFICFRVNNKRDL